MTEKDADRSKIGDKYPQAMVRLIVQPGVLWRTYLVNAGFRR